MSRVMIALMCLAAAGGLGYAAFSDRWLENKTPPNPVAFSLLSAKRCVVESATTTCQSKSNSELMAELAMDPKANASTAFATAGQATFGFSLLSALALLLCAGYLVASKRTAGPNGPQHLTLVALILTLIAATVFIKMKPGDRTGVGVGLGFFVFAAAGVLGMIAAQMAGKLIKPEESELDPTL